MKKFLNIFGIIFGCIFMYSGYSLSQIKFGVDFYTLVIKGIGHVIILNSVFIILYSGNQLIKNNDDNDDNDNSDNDDE